MLSGVGPAKHLTEHQIPIVQNLSVGYNLQDHVGLSGLAFLVNEPITISEGSVQSMSAIFSYYVLGRGPFTLPGGAEGLAFVKTPNSTLGTVNPSSNPFNEIRKIIEYIHFQFSEKLSGHRNCIRCGSFER